MEKVSNERQIRDYLGLSWAQFCDLHSAANGRIRTMNGARKQAMKHLIGEDLRPTEYGLAVLNRQIPDQVEPDFEIPSTASCATRLRKGGHGWVRSAHVKLLWLLYRFPGMTQGGLMVGFGLRTVKELEAQGWIEPGDTMDCGQTAYQVAADGEAVLRSLQLPAGQERG